MPGVNGLDLQGMITTSRSRMPIIFVSGFGDIPMTVRGLKGGALDFLTKPIDTMALLDAVSSAVASSSFSSPRSNCVSHNWMRLAETP
jgi:FixJ family two-component response regulator